MRLIVELPDDTVQWANAEGVNRQTIAKFMREELHAVASRFGHSPELHRPQLPGQSHEWRGFIFNEARVLVPRNKSLKETEIAACQQAATTL
jgi:hypothetical protein